MAHEDEVRVRLVEGLPERRNRGVVRRACRREARVVPVGERAPSVARGQVGDEPVVLRRSASQPTIAQFEFSATRCHAPRSKLYQPSPGVPAACAEVPEVGGAAIVLHVVVADRRPRPIREPHPRPGRSNQRTLRRTRRGRRCRRASARFLRGLRRGLRSLNRSPSRSRRCRRQPTPLRPNPRVTPMACPLMGRLAGEATEGIVLGATLVQPASSIARATCPTDVEPQLRSRRALAAVGSTVMTS